MTSSLLLRSKGFTTTLCLAFPALDVAPGSQRGPGLVLHPAHRHRRHDLGLGRAVANLPRKRFIHLAFAGLGLGAGLFVDQTEQDDGAAVEGLG
jgi:hypothetical protein